MPAGQPPKYKAKYAQMLEDYFSIKAGEDIEVENSKGKIDVVRVSADFPTLAGFACEIGVHRNTLANWAKATDDKERPLYPKFLCAYKKAQQHQERILVQNTLKGGYQPAFAIFTAKNVLGWKDKQEIDNTSSDGSMSAQQTVVILPAKGD